MQVRVNKCERELLIITPINPEKKWACYNYDLEEEIKTLVNNLDNKGLKRDRDYVVDLGPEPKTIPEFNIQFIGQTYVINALYVILNNQDSFKFASPCKPRVFHESLINFVLQITRDESLSIAHIKETVQDNLYKSLVSEIVKIHNKIKETSMAISQLTRDLDAINKHPDEAWGKCNFYLAYAALYHAKIKAVYERKCQKVGIMLFTQENLSDLYQKILDMFNYCVNVIPGYNPHCKEKKKLKFFESCYKDVIALQQNNSAKTKTKEHKLV